MKDLLVIALIALSAWVLIRFFLKEPILPWKEKQVKATVPQKQKGKKNNQKKNEPIDEEETRTFKELFPHVVGFDSHMIRSVDNEFTMIAEVAPVNYYLRDLDEQDVIDTLFETWLATVNYPVRIYLQNRFIDLTEPIEEIQRTIDISDDLNRDALDFAENMIRDLKAWQQQSPRYETKRYLLFDYKVEPKDIRIDNEDDLDERIVEKAFNELSRRVRAAREHLRPGEMVVDLLTTDGIVEVLYYQFNRRKALKNRYRDIKEKETLAMYVTADQTLDHIVKVREEIGRVVLEKKK
jgi:hypothetical protein